MSKKGSPQIVFCHVKDIEDFWLFLDWRINDYWFRGHENTGWHLKTSLERAHEKYWDFWKIYQTSCDVDKALAREYLNTLGYSENPLLRNEYHALSSYARHAHLEGKSMLEIAAHLQHYEGKTRLLDVTSSIFIALFFAFENCNAESRALWAFSKTALYDKCGVKKSLLLPQGMHDGMTFTCNVPKNDYNNAYGLENECFSLANKFFSEDENSGSLQNAGIIPINIEANNSRLVAQNGCFLFPKTLLPFEENLIAALDIKDSTSLTKGDIEFKSVKEYVKKPLLGIPIIKLIFPEKFYKFAQDILHYANISARSIYPDEIGLAKSIRYW